MFTMIFSRVFGEAFGVRVARHRFKIAALRLKFKELITTDTCFCAERRLQATPAELARQPLGHPQHSKAFGKK